MARHTGLDGDRRAVGSADQHLSRARSLTMELVYLHHRRRVDFLPYTWLR